MKPVFHRGLQAVERDFVADFEQTVSGGEGVVEDRVIGEVAHGEAVDVADGAGVALARGIDALDEEAAGEHGLTVNEPAARDD